MDNYVGLVEKIVSCETVNNRRQKSILQFKDSEDRQWHEAPEANVSHETNWSRVVEARLYKSCCWINV